MMSGSLNPVTVVAPINIAVIKYWGKRDETYNLPLNSSLSLTLDMDELSTTTSISENMESSSDTVLLNGKPVPIKEGDRISKCLKKIRKLKAKQDGNDIHCKRPILIESHNSFPTASGLASSASGFACLVTALGQYYGITSDLTAIASLELRQAVRVLLYLNFNYKQWLIQTPEQGSGSACRSMFGGFVEWERGVCPVGSDSIARQVASKDHWPELRVLVLVVTDQVKGTASTVGMQRSARTSELLKHRVSQIVPARITLMKRSILSRNFDEFAKLTMQDSNQLHAICQDTYPPITPPYLNTTSHMIINIITALNQSTSQLKAAYSFDAGPHAFLFTLDEHFNEVLNLILHYFPSDKQGYVRGIENEAIQNEVDSCLIETLSSQNILSSSKPLNYIISSKVGCGPKILN